MARCCRCGLAGVFLIVLACAHSLAGETPSSWQLTKEADGIRIYTRPVAGSQFREYRGVMTVKASLSALAAVIDDANGYVDWVDTCSEARRLNRINSSESVVYTVNRAPWPVKDRDAVVNLSIISKSPQKVVFRIAGAPDALPRNPDLVRVERIEGSWSLTQKDAGMVEVVYQVHSEPGGGLPAWLVNSMVVTQPFRSLSEMRRVLNKPEYENARFEF